MTMGYTSVNGLFLPVTIPSQGRLVFGNGAVFPLRTTLASWFYPRIHDLDASPR